MKTAFSHRAAGKAMKKTIRKGIQRRHPAAPKFDAHGRRYKSSRPINAFSFTDSYEKKKLSALKYSVNDATAKAYGNEANHVYKTKGAIKYADATSVSADRNFILRATGHAAEVPGRKLIYARRAQGISLTRVLVAQGVDKNLVTD